MGAAYSSLFTAIREANVLMLGLDNAGKTTILYQMKLGEERETTPTIGFNVESIKVKGMSLQVWDVGGQTKIRRLWESYYKKTDAVVFVVDSSDSERFSLVNKELCALLDRLPDAVVLVFANKSDLPGSVEPSVLWDELALKYKQFQRPIEIFASDARRGKGLLEGFVWLSNELQKKILAETPPPTPWGVVKSLVGLE